MAVINGTNGADTLVGTSGDDEINGLGGNDILVGSAGADKLNGGGCRYGGLLCFYIGCQRRYSTGYWFGRGWR
ncbi:hypothetical protein LJJ44_04060 [Pseudomonas sp. B24_DOA]|nr:hypothetical protein LJJ44_04060 [Pseudomonas sp. B24_DOA]WKV90773.1 hypothetical protein LJU32_12075 [Pseudomonas sp. B21_DOA]